MLYTTAYEFLKRFDFDEVKRSIYSQTPADVERALAHTHRTVEDFLALVSPAAEAYLEPMAHEAHRLTVERFGRTMQLYLPLYLSNICSNSCVYCGFSVEHKIHRRRLTLAEIDREVEAIQHLGFRHLLLVGGYNPACPIDDKGMLQLILAFRLLDQHLDISLSTRESEAFRNHVLTLGVTSMSAGSHTEPGGYAEQHEELEQFTINDARSPEEFAQYLQSVGYEPVWKDWDSWL